MKLAVDYCAIRRRWTTHSLHFRTYVKDRHTKKRILLKIKHAYTHSIGLIYIQKETNTGAEWAIGYSE